MISIKNILLLAVILFFASCNNVNWKQEQKEKASKNNVFRKINNQSDNTDHFQVRLIFKAEKNDSFQLFYSEEYMIDYLEEKSITTAFQGKDEYQEIVFDVPYGIFPVRYRLDIGSNRDQNEIKIKSMTIRYAKNEIFIAQNLLPIYLIPNNYINYKLRDGKYLLYSLQIEGIDYYDPYFTSSPELIRLHLDL